MGFYLSKRIFDGLIIRGWITIFKTLAIFLHLSLITYADVIESIEFFPW